MVLAIPSYGCRFAASRMASSGTRGGLRFGALHKTFPGKLSCSRHGICVDLDVRKQVCIHQTTDHTTSDLRSGQLDDGIADCLVWVFTSAEAGRALHS